MGQGQELSTRYSYILLPHHHHRGKNLTSEQVIQQGRGATLVDTVSIELSEPTEDVNCCSNPHGTGLGCERRCGQQGQRCDWDVG